jgi:hypothetical protein
MQILEKGTTASDQGLHRRVSYAKAHCFKAYDVRQFEELEDLAYRIGRAYAAFRPRPG